MFENDRTKDSYVQNFGLVLEFREFIRVLKLKVGGKGVLQDAVFQDPLVEMDYPSPPVRAML